MEHEGVRGLNIQRILVALDASPSSRAALDAAVELAARFGAEVLGVYVEDVNLIRMGDLPIARQVGSYTAGRSYLEPTEIALQLRVEAGRLRQTLTMTATRRKVRHDFRVARGAVAAELTALAAEADLVILGKSAWSLTSGRRMGTTTRAVLGQAQCLALVIEEGRILGEPVLVVFEESELGAKALAAAAALVPKGRPSLIVLTLADDEDGNRRLQQHAAEQLGDRQADARFRSLSVNNAARLAARVHSEGCGTLVLPARSAIMQDEALAALLDDMEIPVLLVR
ncbi:MAG: universal stress protein [Anaerolineae bacterium]